MKILELKEQLEARIIMEAPGKIYIAGGQAVI